MTPHDVLVLCLPAFPIKLLPRDLKSLIGLDYYLCKVG